MRYFTVPEASSVLGKSQHTVRHMIRTGKLEAKEAEGKEKWLIPDSALFEMVKQSVRKSKLRKKSLN